jgi:glycosyltransferase involved in cell wall biosynthesis
VRIAVNTRLLLPGKLDGMGWFAYHTLKRITAGHPEHEFIFLFDRPCSDEFVFGPNVKPVSLFPQARHPFLYYLWFEHAVPRALKKHRADLFLSPDGYLSLSARVPQVAVMHDLNFEHYPADLPFLTRNYYRYFFPRFARKAARIATVSEYSKSDIVSCYGIDPGNIDVVYNGVNDLYKPLPPAEISSVRRKYAGGAPYFLFVGMLHQRKNMANLLRAYELFRGASPLDIKLVLVGHKKWWTAEMESVYSMMRFRESVVFLGRRPIDELVRITAAALAATYVSTFEGFGVPIVEAMRCGVPVITSQVTSMPEVAGDAALLADPFNPGSIASAMGRMASESALRDELIKSGLERSARFSWDDTSVALWNSMIRAMERAV